MKWLEIAIKTTQEASDAISEMLTSLGAGGVAIEEPDNTIAEISSPGLLNCTDNKFLDGLQKDVVIKAYFPDEGKRDELIKHIKNKIEFISNFLSAGEGYIGCNEVNDEDWSTSWKKYYKAIRLSDRIIIKPSWETYSAGKKEVVIEIDPGMAFGTGTHDTTQMCAKLLEKYVREDCKVIDLGCGTGILSIIAAKLGAGSVTAVDVDKIAVKVSKENCALNSVQDKINIIHGTIRDLPLNESGVKADIIIANIITDVILDLAEDIPRYLVQGGYFIVSGIIRERKQEIIKKYQDYGFILDSSLDIGEWVAVVFKCLGSL
jgi:ribosomal protein L11 methyltransferase